MKSERRHELQHNDLAEWILKTYGQIVPYKNTILGVGLLLIVVLIGMSLWHSHSVAEAGEAWSSLGIPVFQPVFADERTINFLQHSTQTYPGTSAAQWAQVFTGDTFLMVGTNKILTEKKVGIDYLTQARDFYAEALKTLTIPGAQEQAMFGKARAIESLSQRKAQIDEAITAYKELNERFPHGMFKAIADQRMEQLQKKETLRFYEALAQYTPKPKVESPRSQLGKLGPLPENPPDEPPVPTPPVRGDGSSQGPALGIPVPSLTPTEPKPEAPKSEPAKPQAAKPEPAKTDISKPDASKTEAAKPEAAKKDK
ncbi:MAG: hypothetical protein ACLP9L_17935 [Thermoguttaceae bacterium]